MTCLAPCCHMLLCSRKIVTSIKSSQVQETAHNRPNECHLRLCCDICQMMIIKRDESVGNSLPRFTVPRRPSHSNSVPNNKPSTTDPGMHTVTQSKTLSFQRRPAILWRMNTADLGRCELSYSVTPIHRSDMLVLAWLLPTLYASFSVAETLERLERWVFRLV